MPRLAAVLDKQLISDVTKIHDKNMFDRPIYAGNAIATVKSNEKIKLITIRGTAFDPYKEVGGESNFISLELPNEIETNRFISKEETKTERPELSSTKNSNLQEEEELDLPKTLKLLKTLQISWEQQLEQMKRQ